MKVKLHSNDKSAAEATDSTIKMLPGVASLKRDNTGEIEFDSNGYAIVENSSVFIEYALRNQGYVAEIIESD